MSPSGLRHSIPRGVDGEPGPERIGRVAWSRSAADGGSRLDVPLLDRELRTPERAAGPPPHPTSEALRRRPGPRA